MISSIIVNNKVTPSLTSSVEVDNSVAQFSSEQDLFGPEAIPLPESRPESPCDLVTFLSMGHVKNCWCGDCDDAPELIGREDLKDGAVDDDGDDAWALVSTGYDDGTEPLTPVTIIDTTDDDDDDDQDFSRRPHSSVVSGWDMFFPRNPGTKPFAEPEDEFLAWREREASYDWLEEY
jgi:hypothetical protein